MDDFQDAQETFTAWLEDNSGSSKRASSNFSHTNPSDISSDQTTSKRKRAQQTLSPSKSKIKSIFRSQDQLNGFQNEGKEDVLSDVDDSEAFNPATVLGSTKPGSRTGSDPNLLEKTRRGFDSFTAAIAHPRQTVRNKVTGTAAERFTKAQRPLVTAEQDQELLDAHEDLADAVVTSEGVAAESDASTSGIWSAEEVAQRKVKEIESNREDLRIAWSLGRHVDRVRVVRLTTQDPPRMADFRADGKLQWPKYLGATSLHYTRSFTEQYVDEFVEISFDMEDLSRIGERLLITSAPWQAWLMSVRSVYLWEDPRYTTKWMVLYWFLWYFEYIGCFFFAYIIYATIYNRLWPSAIETLSAGDASNSRAKGWSDLQQRYGKNWVEPYLDDQGPNIQLQLYDLVNAIEVFNNFYRWENPKQTAASLFFLLCCTIVGIFSDAVFGMKLVYFLLGIMYFFCWPLAVYYPKYHYLLGPIKWFFWNVPTEAELSIAQLQGKAIVRQARFHENGIHQPKQRIGEVFEFACRDGSTGAKGRLLIDELGIRFMSRSDGMLFDLRYSHLDEIRKVDPVSPKVLLTLQRGSFGKGGLELHYRIGADDIQECSMQRKTFNLSSTAERDEVFNIMLGWSGIKWRVLQMEKPKNNRPGASHLDGVLHMRPK